MAIGLAAIAQAQSTPVPRSVDSFLTDPAAYDGQLVVLDGFLSLEDYAKALFVSAESYEASHFDDSVPVIVSNLHLDQRERYERRNVRITGQYDHACARAGSFCSAHPGQGRIFVTSIETLPQQPVSTGWRRRDILSAPHGLVAESQDGALTQTASVLFSDIAQRNRIRLRTAASGEGGTALVDDLYDPQSRSTWLLFSGENAYSSWMQEHPDASLTGFTLANDPIEPRLGAACLCAEADCAPVRDLQADRITNRNLSDPYICLTFVEGENGWELDPGMLLSMWRMGEHGNDLGVVLEDESEEGDTLVWRWVTTPGLTHAYFATRLRHQPRARVWHFVKAGYSDVGVFVSRPDGQFWNMDPNDGDPQITLEESLPEGAPDITHSGPGAD